MKKILFTALACVAFAFSGFASNEEVEGNEFVADLDLFVYEQPTIDAIVGEYMCVVISVSDSSQNVLMSS